MSYFTLFYELCYAGEKLASHPLFHQSDPRIHFKKQTPMILEIEVVNNGSISNLDA